MSNPTITYNGVSSASLGLIVRKLPDFHRAQRRVQQISVPGRDGVLVLDEGGYDAYTTDITLNANGADLATIHNWLRGEGWMISSDEPQRMAYVYCYAQLDDVRRRVGADNYDDVSIQLVVEPYLRAVNEAAVTLTSQGSIPGQGHDPALPKLTITGTGSANLIVNGSGILLDDLSGTLVIDCELGAVYEPLNDGVTWAGEKATLAAGWPSLRVSGNNLISWTGGITEVVVQPQWRWL